MRAERRGGCLKPTGCPWLCASCAFRQLCKASPGLGIPLEFRDSGCVFCPWEPEEQVVEEQEVHVEGNAVPAGDGQQVAQPECCEGVGQSV